MKLRKLNLTDQLKQGLSPLDPTTGSGVGWATLENARTDGMTIKSCDVETTVKFSEPVRVFNQGIEDYILKASGIFDLSNTVVYSKSWSGSPKVIDLIKYAIIQDDVSTIFVDSDGVYTTNPSGRTIPRANSLIALNGQIIAGGIKDLYNNLTEDYIAWSGIATDDFSITKSNDAGMGHPNIGRVHSLYPLQDSIIVLGSRGASQMYYAGHIFGFRDLDLPLAKAANLGASSTNICLYVAKDGSIIKVDKSGNFERLGFSWLGSQTLSVRYLNGRNWFVFNTADRSYVLDSQGFFSFNSFVYGESTDALVTFEDFSQDTSTIRTLFSDYGRVGVKTLHEVYLQERQDGVTGAIKVYSDNISRAGETRFLNRMGVTKYPMSGNLLSIEYKKSGSFEISSFMIEVFDADRRFGIGTVPYVRGQ